MGGLTSPARKGPGQTLPPLNAERARLESAMLALQAGRVAFTSAVMRLRYVPVEEQRRALRRATIAFVRLQKLTAESARLLES